MSSHTGRGVAVQQRPARQHEARSRAFPATLGLRLLAPLAIGGLLLGACAPTDPEFVRGKELFSTYQCTTCHTVTGDQVPTGPTLKGLFGSQVPLDNGTSVTADEAYLRESILQPNAKVRAGWFSDQMLTISGQHQKELENPENLNALIAYIKGVK